MIKNRRRVLAALVLVVLGAVVAFTAAGRGGHATAGTVWKADEKPNKDIKHDKSAPLKTITPKKGPKGQRTRPEHRFTTETTATKDDPVVQSSAPTSLAPTAGTNFEGVATADISPNYIPPDPNAAVGPNAIVEVVNTAFEVFSKTGGSLYGPADTSTIWTGFGGDCENYNDGDATVSYDRIDQRWVMQQFAVSGSAYKECIAVSETSDPTGSWYRYEFGGFGGEFPDYPKLGVWPDAYYVTYNLFPDNWTFDGPEVCAYERARMLDGLSADQLCKQLNDNMVNGLLPSDFDGSTLPPVGEPNYLLGVKQDTATTTNSIVMYSMAVDWSTNHSTLTNLGDVAGVAPFNLACDDLGCDRIPEKNGVKLDSLGDRLMYRLAYRNLPSGQAWVVDHTVMTGSVAGVRWYQLGSPSGDTGAPTLTQQGTYAPGDGKWRWMGSAAMDSSGNMALGYSISNSSIYPGIAYTGRLFGDAAGTMTQGETVVRCGAAVSGCGSQTTYSRWGDYTSMSIDPADDCTFWYTNQYLPNTGVFNWKTRLASFKLPGCVAATVNQFSLSPTPSSVTIAQGSSDISTISSSITSGSAQIVNLTASGAPFDTTVSFGPSSINSGDTSTMTVDVGDNTPAGTYTLTVRGTGAADVRTTTVTLRVTAFNAVVNGDFENGLTGWTNIGGPTIVPTTVPTPLVKKKKAGPVTPGNSAQIGSTTSTAGDSTLYQDVLVPTGTTALSFWYRPTCTSITTGDQIQIQIQNTAGTPLQPLVAACTKSKNWLKAAFDTSAYVGQTIRIWFNAHGTGVRKKPTYALIDDVVLSRQVPDVANGGFEAGLGGWQATGTGIYAPTVVTSPTAHGGTHSLRLGSITDPNNVASNSGVSQAVVVPGINPVLTLWYQPHCVDQGYDYVQVQLKKNPGGQVLGTLLNSCTNWSSWTKATFNLSAWAGQSVTLVLNVSSDTSIQTDALFDDISITHS
jgi:hypothetical protein